MFLIETKEGKELDRWSTKKLAVESARAFLRDDPQLRQVLVWEGNQATGRRVKVETVRR